METFIYLFKWKWGGGKRGVCLWWTLSKKKVSPEQTGHSTIVVGGTESREVGI